MPKRKREVRRPPSVIVISDSEDEVVVAPASFAQRSPRNDSEDSGLDDKRDQLRAGATAITNGIVTPVTLEKSSEVDRSIDEAREIEIASEEDLQAAPLISFRPNLHAKTTRVLVPDCRDGSEYPRCLYQGWKPPLDEVSELKALAGLTEAHRNAYVDDDDEKPDFTYFSLDNFSIYRSANAYGHGSELVTLDRLSKARYPEFCFDGILSFGARRFYVRNVPFATLTVDGYGNTDTSAADMSGQLCIQSSYAKRHDAWYKLGTPALEYMRFYTPFLWLARFTKHFVDYLLCTQEVTIAHFREAFHAWLQETSGHDASLHTWLREANLRDFRTTVAAHVEFLWKECYGTQQPSDDINICEHPIWGEAHPARLTAIPEQPNIAKRTIVTPFAYDCFKSMYFADQFLETPITDVDVWESVQELKVKLGLTPLYEPPAAVLTPISEARETTVPPTVPITSDVTEIDVGDVVMLPPEKEGRWQSIADCWYAYVQRIRTTKDGKKRLDVIWLYHPSDTTIGNAYYPFQNEMFFSDNCGCDTRDHQEAWDIEEVIQKVDVTWFARDPYKENDRGLFVRQKFRTVPEMGHYDFVTLQDNDFRCHHQPEHIDEDGDEAYAVGDVVLVRVPTAILCEIAQIVGGRGKHLRLRRLLKKRDSQPSARANELISTSEVFEARCDRAEEDEDEDEDYQVVRKCHVRQFTREEIDTGNVLTPYDRNGAGDYFIMEAEMADDAASSTSAPEIDFPSINQSWDPRRESAIQQLTGLGIFCGGGTFDRGLEEGGAVKFRHAVDWAEHALHSYRANLRDPEEVNFFLGSVNDYLEKALSGQPNVAKPGSIHVISAGSPCQGFSRMQLFTNSEASKQNASMVASVVAFADLYCPQYMVLENVLSMTECRNERKEHNVFSQILGALVGLGYQVQQFLIDSWSYGSSQQRPRLFILATVPGLAPLPQPECSHAHPPHMKMRNLGTSSNGLPFGTRRFDPDVAFHHTSPREAVGDLPPVYDSLPQLCPAFPDHRTATEETDQSRIRIRAVPTYPRGMALIQAWQQGLLSGEPLDFCNRAGHVRKAKSSKMYARVLPDGLFPAILTSISISDGMNGRFVHWDQHRALTILEAKRAQGYIDHEVLIGSAVQQMKIVGNSVDRKAALALGLALRESWLKSYVESVDVDMDNSFIESTGVDMVRDEAATRLDSIDVDNRTVKMSLTLSREDIEGVNKVTATTGKTFKEILRILSEKEEHRTARQSLRGTVNEASSS